MAMNEEILLNVMVQNQDALKNIGELSEKNKELKTSLDEIKEAYKRGEVSEAEYGKQKAIISAQTRENTNGIRENSKELKTNAADVASAGDSINGMRARIADLTRTYNSLSQEARDGDVGKMISSEMVTLSTNVNSANKSVGNFKDNIGRYPDAMANIGLSNTKAGQAMEKLGITADMSMGQVGAAVSGMVKAVSGSLKVLLANPIILIVTAIAAAFMALYSVFKDFTPLLDKIEQGMASVGAVFDTLKGAITGFLSGQKSLTESTKGLGNAMSKAATQAGELKKAQQDLEDSQDGLDIKNKRDETQIQKLLLQAKNRTISEKERIKFLADADKLNEQIFKRGESQNKQEVKNAEDALIIKWHLSKQDAARLRSEGSAYARKLEDTRQGADAEIKTLTAALLKKEEVNQKYIAIQEGNQNKSDKLEDAAADKADKAAATKAAKRDKDIQASAAREVKRISELEKSQSAEIKKEENLLSIKKLNSDQLDKTRLTESDYFKGRISQLEQSAKDEKAITDLKYKYGKLTKEEYDLAILTSDKAAAIAKVELQKEQALQLTDALTKEVEAVKAKNELISAEEDSVKQRKLDDLSNELSSLNENSARALEIKKAQLDAQMREEMKAAEKSGASQILIKKKFDNEKKKLDAIADAAKLDSASRIAGGLASILGKSTKAGKLAAAASVAINTYKDAAAAIGSMAGAGPVGWALGAVEAGVIVGSGLKAINDIYSVKEDGGASSISAPNTGGVPSGNTVSGNFSVPQNINGLYGSSAQQTETAQTIASSQPTPVVKVSEITEMQNSVSVKENSKL